MEVESRVLHLQDKKLSAMTRNKTRNKTRNRQPWPERHQQILLLILKEGTDSADTLILKSRREEIMVVLSYWVCGHLSQQSQEIPTKGKHELNYEALTVWEGTGGNLF